MSSSTPEVGQLLWLNEHAWPNTTVTHGSIWAFCEVSTNYPTHWTCKSLATGKVFAFYPADLSEEPPNE